MLNRYSITATPKQLGELFHVEVPEFYKPRYNAAPSQLMPVITAGAARGISWFYWGIPPERSRNKPVSEKLLFRKAVDLANRSSQRNLLLHHRCEIPVDGFYIWKHVGRKTLIPYRVTPANNRPFAVAGTWEEYESENGEMHHTFSMVCIPAPEELSGLTEWIPLILDPEAQKTWGAWHASERDLAHVLTTAQCERMTFHTVSPAIEDSRLDIPALMENAPAADQFGNLTLFG